MDSLKQVKMLLDTLTFFLTILLFSYGFLKGLDVFELKFNLIYFTTVLITLLISLFENAKSMKEV